MAIRADKNRWKAKVSLPANATPANPCTNVRTWEFEIIDQGIPGCEPKPGMIVDALDLIGPVSAERRAAPARVLAKKAAARKGSPKKSAKRKH
jgi:hypothetical protein